MTDLWGPMAGRYRPVRASCPTATLLRVSIGTDGPRLPAQPPSPQPTYILYLNAITLSGKAQRVCSSDYSEVTERDLPAKGQPARDSGPLTRGMRTQLSLCHLAKTTRRLAATAGKVMPARATQSDRQK